VFQVPSAPGLPLETFEASVTVLVFHHPDCTYFSAAEVETAVEAR
jgi:hypothetical protein